MLFDLLNAYRQAFRMFIRRRTRPKTIEEAEEKTLFWAKCYALCGIFSMFVATYFTAVNKPNIYNFKEGVPKEETILDHSASRPTRLIKIHNFSKVDDYVYVPKKESTQSVLPGKQEVTSNPWETSEKVGEKEFSAD